MGVAENERGVVNSIQNGLAMLASLIVYLLGIFVNKPEYFKYLVNILNDIYVNNRYLFPFVV